MRISFEERLLLLVVGLTVAAALLLVSAGMGTEEGHRPWQPGSVLQFVTRLLNFDYAYPTPRGASVKRLAAALGAGAALVIAALMWCRRHSPRSDAAPETAPAANAETPAPKRKRWHETLSPAEAAQLAMLALVAWAFASTAWSAWPEVSTGGSILLAIGVLWAVCLGRTFSRRAATTAALLLLGVLVVTASIGIWYYYERNPFQRLKFPVGNPLPMAACLLPGVFIALHMAAGSVWTAFASRRYRRLVWLLPSLAAMAPLLWAIRLTGSRSAIAGLTVGLWTAVALRVRGPWRWLTVLVLAAGLYGGYRYARVMSTQVEGGRGATIRARYYGWKYACRLFLIRPAGGHGEGGYSLAVDAMARGDAEKDPAAFAGERLVHAHNDWLEMLADLGAVGIALAAVGYGVTFWASAPPKRGSGASMQSWCFAGLVAALAGLIAEQATDVGLRLPGLPVVWYTVLGLVWAMMRAEEAPTDRAVPFPRPLLWLGTGLAFAVAAILCVCSANNWRGALADARVPAWMEQQNWREAIAAAELGADGRLATEEITDAVFRKIACYADVASFHLHAVRQSSPRQPPGAAPSAPTESQRQDFEIATHYTATARDESMTFLARAPAYPFVAGTAGRLLLLYLSTARGTGFQFPDGVVPRIEEEARGLLLAEYERDRLDVSAALQCVIFCPERPVEERVEWMCTGLRGVPMPGGTEEYREVLYGLLADPQFGPAVARRSQAARDDYDAAGAAGSRDAFAPEALRLWAMLRAHQRGFGEAADAVAPAVAMYRTMRVTNPGMAAVALAEQAEYAFRNSPDAPGMAIELANEAIREVPPIGGQQPLITMIQRELALYLLAHGRQDEAAERIGEVIGTDDAEAVRQQVGMAYVTLGSEFIGVPADRRPKQFGRWLEAAGEMAPQSEAVDAYRRAETLGLPAENLTAILEQTVQRWPDSRLLAELVASRRPGATSAPATRSAPPEETATTTRAAEPAAPQE